MSKNVFKQPREFYKSRVDPINDYIKQSSRYLSKVKGISIEKATEFVKATIRNNPHGKIKNPKVKYFHRNEFGDKIEKETNLYEYIQSSYRDGLIVAPSFTCYNNHHDKKSLHVEFIGDNVKGRSVAKENAFVHKIKGNYERFNFFNNLQKTKKIFNNSLSGAYASKSTIVYNPSAHYTLTSMTRTLTSIGNALTESMVAGNRHYREPDIVINHIASLTINAEYDAIELAVKTFNLIIPTVNDLMEIVLYSSRLYWTNLEKEAEILKALNSLSEMERVVFAYTNDLYHLRKFNENLVRNLVTNMSKTIIENVDDPLKLAKSSDGYLLNLVHHILSKDLSGKKIVYKDMVGMPELDMIAATAQNIEHILADHELLFKPFFSTPNIPSSVAYLPDILRRVTVLSDTDSTCATYQEWVSWFYGEIRFDPASIGVSASVMTIVTQVISHALNVYTSNMNVPFDYIHLLTMKNEFFWLTMTPMNVSKHYFADTKIQEGNVFKETELEIKGNNLISSNTPIHLQKRSKDMMKEINSTVASGSKLKLTNYIKEIADIERSIVSAILAGDITIFKSDSIKDSGSYKQEPAKSNYIHYLFWEEVLTDKYGHCAPPPYAAIRISTILTSRKSTNDFINTIEDPMIKEKFLAFLTKYSKDAMGTFRLPIDMLKGNGIPKELQGAIDIDRIVSDICNPFYMILESIGFYKKDKLKLIDMGY